MFSSGKIKELFLGIDGGGSKCKAIVINEDNDILGTGIAGPGNPSYGVEQATNAITQSAKLALENAGLAHIKLNELNAGVGLAGVNLPILFEQMQVWQHPFKQMFLATDILIACLGAHQGQDGAVIISGTGSCGFSYVNGQEFIIGGHGFPQGDKGSGAWFGLQVATQVLLSLDSAIEPSIMNDMLLTKLGCKDDIALVEAIAGKGATQYAQLAHIAFDAAGQGDKIALKIVTEGAEYMNTIARILWKKKPPRMSMIGGISAKLRPWLDTEIQTKLSEPLNSPEVGSVFFARREMASRTLLKNNNRQIQIVL